MTQIITLACEEYILMAADRRLTTSSTVESDEAIKLVNLCNQAVIGYTGISEIRKENIELWLARNLAKIDCRSIDVAFNEIITLCNEAKEDSAYFRTKEQTFVIAGWSYQQDKQLIHPNCALISNRLQNYFTNTRKLEHNIFEGVICKPKTGESFVLNVIGQPLEEKNMKALSRAAQNLIDRKIGPKAMLVHLTNAILETSRNSRTVGSEILNCCIPGIAVAKEIRQGSNISVANSPSLNEVSFLSTSRGQEELVQHAPIFVCGETVLSGFEAKPLSD